MGIENYRNKILVVDDEPVNVELVTAILESDYEIIPAYNGKEALEKIASDKPDIVLLDIMMPDVNGYDVCQKIKQQETTRFIPVVMITALSELEDKIKAINSGADDFLTKPIRSVELVTRVKSLLRAKYFHDMLIESKEIIEAQNDFRTVMTNILPFLFQHMPPDKKTEIMRDMIKQVEGVIWAKYVHELPDDVVKTAAISCNIMNRLGGSFSIESSNEKGYTVINKNCPWGNYGNINPAMCMLTRAVFARVGIRVFKTLDVEVKKTIAGGDGHCLLEVSGGKD